MKITNKLISTANSLRYKVTEPLKLKKAREGCEDSKGAPLISICLPTYNRVGLLMKRAVRSVLAQTYTNWELIIIDDGSTDDTYYEVMGIMDARVKYHRTWKRAFRYRPYPPTPRNNWLAGPVVALNEALSRVKGQYIARIDDDDIWTDDHLETLLRVLTMTGAEFASASYIEERKGVRRVMDHKDCQPRIGGVCTWMYRSYLKFFKYNINCWRKEWNAVNDTDLADRMFKADVNMVYVDKVIAYILPRPGETTVGLDAYLEKG